MAGRKGDIMMMVSQNNSAQQVLVESVDERLGKIEHLLGYGADAMVGHSLNDFLPATIKEQLEDYLEFTPAGKDLADVLSRCRNFGLVNKQGQIVKLNMRVQRDVIRDEKARFIIVMRGEDKVSEGVLKELAEFKEFAQLDADTDLLTLDSMLKSANITQRGVNAENTIASFAVLEIDNYLGLHNNYTKPLVDGLLKEVAIRCHQTFRDADIIAYHGQGKFSVLLLEADATNARIPLQRLRSVIANQPLYLNANNHVSFSISIAYKQMKKGEMVETIIRQCEEMLVTHHDGGNHVYEV
jgi:diguanylate cyclase (GGDEF)-like protein